MITITPDADCHLKVLECWRNRQSATVIRGGKKADEYIAIAKSYHGEPALITWTSGTTGEPKGVVIPWSAVEARCQSLSLTLDHEMMQVVASELPPYHSGGLITSRLFTHTIGGKVVPWDEREQATCIVAMPPTLAIMAKSANPDPHPKLRLIISNGSLLTGETRLAVETNLGVPVLDLYGASECGGVAFNGKIMPGYDVDLEDGVIRIRTDALASGYLNADHPIRIADGFFNTGDAGYLDAGVLHIAGRKAQACVAATSSS